jgi:hypothetical protein
MASTGCYGCGDRPNASLVLVGNMHYYPGHESGVCVHGQKDSATGRNLFNPNCVYQARNRSIQNSLRVLEQSFMYEGYTPEDTRRIVQAQQRVARWKREGGIPSDQDTERYLRCISQTVLDEGTLFGLTYVRQDK